MLGIDYFLNVNGCINKEMYRYSLEFSGKCKDR